MSALEDFHGPIVYWLGFGFFTPENGVQFSVGLLGSPLVKTGGDLPELRFWTGLGTGKPHHVSVCKWPKQAGCKPVLRFVGSNPSRHTQDRLESGVKASIP